MSASDPFYLVKEEIQDTVTKLQTTLDRWEKLPVSSTERTVLSREILSTCESIEWQVDELDKATGVAERDPARFSVDAAEIERRKRWTSSTRTQVHSVTGKVQSTPVRNIGTGTGATNRRELMRLDDQFQQTPVRTDHDSYISNESDRQELLLREQDDDLDELSASLGRIGHVGLLIDEDVGFQGGIMDKLSNDMDGTATRLDLVQKKLATVMKKAGWKAQVLTIVFLVVLLVILTLLVFSA
ncbi:hypothetical protein M758_1G300700 [Ceratodon purpureus]|nr:hypothetical protein M758_1G300700 [Ceratodon purpureus]